MVRYELILRRYPKLSAAQVPERMGDLPQEFSEGTLQSALNTPDGGPVSIAWGDRRKSLLLIQRRIEILGGSAELIDRSGPFAKWITEHLDAIRDRIKGKKRKQSAVPFDPARASRVFYGFFVLCIAGLLAYAQFGAEAQSRVHVLTAAGFAAGILGSQLFVRGVRSWYGGEGRAWVAALFVLVPMVSLAWAGFEAHALGLTEHPLAVLKGESVATHKPLMKPFTALVVELRRRQQRAELAKALAEMEAERKATQPAQGAAADGGAAVGAAPVEGAAAEGGAAKPAANHAAAKSHRGKGSAAKPLGQSHAEHAGAVRPAQQHETVQTQVSVGIAPPCEEPPVLSMPSALEAVAVSATPAPVQQPAHIQQPPAAPKPVVRQLAPDDTWGPLRSVTDVNEVHVFVALVLACVTFVMGVRRGRSQRLRAALALEQSVVPEAASTANDNAVMEGGEQVQEGWPSAEQEEAEEAAIGRRSSRPAAARSAYPASLGTRSSFPPGQRGSQASVATRSSSFPPSQGGSQAVGPRVGSQPPGAAGSGSQPLAGLRGSQPPFGARSSQAGSVPLGGSQPLADLRASQPPFGAQVSLGTGSQPPFGAPLSAPPEPAPRGSQPLAEEDRGAQLLQGARSSLPPREWSDSQVPPVDIPSADADRASAVGGKARKPDPRRAGAYSAHGVIQEEQVTPRRRDNRRDD
jgi:hypothetical protein